MNYVNNLEHPEECVLFIALHMELLCFFSNVFGHPGLHPNKSEASSLDIAHGYWVAFVNICRRRI